MAKHILVHPGGKHEIIDIDKRMTLRQIASLAGISGAGFHLMATSAVSQTFALPNLGAYGNTDYPVRGTSVSFPQSRRLLCLGDSRMDKSGVGELGSEIVSRCGEWVWCGADWLFAKKGSSTYDMSTRQMDNAIAANGGKGTFVIFTGHNGSFRADPVEKPARPEGKTESEFEAELRFQHIIDAIRKVDVDGNTVFVFNCAPHIKDAGVEDAIKPAIRDRINALADPTVAATYVDHVRIAVVDSWGALTGGDYGAASNPLPEFAGDGVHQSTQGQEVLAKAVWQAMQDTFGDDVQADFANPVADFVDLSNLKDTARGPMPSSFDNRGNETHLHFEVLDDGVRMYNPHAEKQQMAVRIFPDVVEANAFVWFEFDLPDGGGATTDLKPGSSDAVYDTYLRSTSIYDNFHEIFRNLRVDMLQPRLYGGRMRVAYQLGDITESSVLDMRWTLNPGAELIIRKIAIYSGA